MTRLKKEELESKAKIAKLNENLAKIKKEHADGLTNSLALEDENYSMKAEL